MLGTLEPYFIMEPLLKSVVPKKFRPALRAAYKKHLYKGNKVECPCCGGQFSQFLPFGYRQKRLNAQCPQCNALERHRLLWMYLRNETRLFHPDQHAKVLHVAPEACFEEAFRKIPNVDYLSIDLENPRAMQKMDLTNLPLVDNSFDVIFCIHVLEHIPDAAQAIREMYRVLKPGGLGIILVPIDRNLPKTLDDPTIVTPEDRTRFYGQYDHVRQYGLDYPEYLSAGGFQVEVIENYAQRLDQASIQRHGIRDCEDLYISRKPS
jgi:SAM-dependent methyltransferase